MISSFKGKQETGSNKENLFLSEYAKILGGQKKSEVWNLRSQKFPLTPEPE